MRRSLLLIGLVACGGPQVAAPPPDTGGDFVLHGRDGEGIETYTVEHNERGIWLESKATFPGDRHRDLMLQLTEAWAPMSGNVRAVSGGELIIWVDLAQSNGLLTSEAHDDTGEWTSQATAPVDLYFSAPPYAPLTSVCVAAEAGRTSVHLLTSKEEETRTVTGAGTMTIRMGDVTLACDGTLLIGVDMHENRALRIGREPEAAALLDSP